VEAAAKAAERFRTRLVRCREVDLDVGARLLVMRTREYGGLVVREWTIPTARPQIAVIE
jgi:hypothetical protein